MVLGDGLLMFTEFTLLSCGGICLGCDGCFQSVDSNLERCVKRELEYFWR